MFPKLSTTLSFTAALMLFAGLSATTWADDAAIATALKAKGAEVTLGKTGEISGLNFKDPKTLADADYHQIQQIPHLKALSFGLGFDDAGLKALGTLPELETLSTNGMACTDDGFRVLATYKALHNIAIFHPGKGFTGTGLEALAALPAFESLTVAGSTEFGDAGMAAVGKLSHLKGFRTWHSGVGVDGVKKLSTLKDLKSLVLGQRLAMKPPVTVSDEAVVALASVSSLESLSLQEARLTVPALAQLKQLPHLKKLILDNIDLTDAQVGELRQQLPGVDIKFTAPNEQGKKRIDALFGAK